MLIVSNFDHWGLRMETKTCNGIVESLGGGWNLLLCVNLLFGGCVSPNIIVINLVHFTWQFHHCELQVSSVCSGLLEKDPAPLAQAA